MCLSWKVFFVATVNIADTDHGYMEDYMESYMENLSSSACIDFYTTVGTGVAPLWRLVRNVYHTHNITHIFHLWIVT